MKPDNEMDNEPRTLNENGEASGTGPGEAMHSAPKPKFPSVTEDSIKANILDVSYSNPFPSTPHLTVCGIRMKNGFVVLGKSAPVSAMNFDRAIGEKLAYEDAFKQLWALEGYALATHLAAIPVTR